MHLDSSWYQSWDNCLVRLQFFKKRFYTFQTTSNAIVPVPLIWLDSERFPLFQTTVSKRHFKRLNRCVLCFNASRHLEKFPMCSTRAINVWFEHWRQFSKIFLLRKSELPSDGSFAYPFMNHHMLVLVLPDQSGGGVLMQTTRLLILLSRRIPWSRPLLYIYIHTNAATIAVKNHRFWPRFDINPFSCDGKCWL